MAKLIQLTFLLDVQGSEDPLPPGQEEEIVAAMAALLLQVLAAGITEEVEDDRRS